MRHSISLNLIPEAPTKEFIAIFNKVDILKDPINILTTDYTQFSQSVKYINGLYSNSPAMMPSQRYFVYGFFKMIAKYFGEKHLNLMDGKLYPYFNNDFDVMLIIDDKEYIENELYFRMYHIKNGKIIKEESICDKSICHPFERVKMIDFETYRGQAEIINPFTNNVNKNLFDLLMKDDRKKLTLAKDELDKIENTLKVTYGV